MFESNKCAAEDIDLIDAINDAIASSDFGDSAADAIRHKLHTHIAKHEFPLSRLGCIALCEIAPSPPKFAENVELVTDPSMDDCDSSPPPRLLLIVLCETFAVTAPTTNTPPPKLLSLSSIQLCKTSTRPFQAAIPPPRIDMVSDGPIARLPLMFAPRSVKFPADKIPPPP